ncbi:MAG: DinB family protein [Chloroflexi bacterium]|nr:DinB family protein [Chloroflexota bacterium]
MSVPEIADLEQKLEAHRRELYDQVKALSDARLREHLSGNEWSAKQQLAHVRQAEEAWLGWALQVRAHPGAEIGPFDSLDSGAVATADDRSLDELLAALDAQREQTLAAIRRLSFEDLQRKGRHSDFGELTVLQCLRALYRHQRMHMDQIAGREQSFIPGGRS